MFEVEIRSLAAMCEEIDAFSGWNLVSIRNVTGGKFVHSDEERNALYDIIDSHAEQFASMLVLRFDDTWLPGRGVAPTFADVQKALEWAKGKEKIVVHCSGGVSRSSAMAYVVACQAIGIEEALRKLDFKRHAPNQLIVSHAASLLDNDQIFYECDRMERLHRNFIGGQLIQ